MQNEPQLDATPTREQSSASGAPAARRLAWRLFGACAAVVAFIWVAATLHGREHAPTIAANTVTVAVAKVVREDLAEEQSFDAEFRPFQEIDLHAKVAGFVRSMNVDIGDRVHEGQLLATLEIPELQEDLDKALAQARRNEEETNRAAAAYQDTHLAFTRLSSISKTKNHLIAQQELDTAQSRDRSAEASLAGALQEVAVSQAEVKKLQAMMDFCKITAPFSGVITRRFADEGALVQGGVTPSTSAMPLVRLSQTDRLRLVFPVSVSYVSEIKDGQPVEIRIHGSEKKVVGKITRFTHKVDTATRKMDAEVDVTNADYSLIPGVYASVALKFDERNQALTVPAEAVSRGGKASVLVVNAKNEIEERPVKLGVETAAKVEVISGVKEGELVIVGNRTQLRPGTVVEPKIIETGLLK